MSQQIINNNIEDQIINIFNEKEPILKGSFEEIAAIKDAALSQFKQAEKNIKDNLINDTSVKEEDLERIYIESLELAKKEIFEKASREIEEIQKKYLKP